MQEQIGCPYWPDCGCDTRDGSHTCEWGADQKRRWQLDELAAKAARAIAEFFRRERT